MNKWLPVADGLPKSDVWCWVSDGDSVWIARFDVKERKWIQGYEYDEDVLYYIPLGDKPDPPPDHPSRTIVDDLLRHPNDEVAIACFLTKEKCPVCEEEMTLTGDVNYSLPPQYHIKCPRGHPGVIGRGKGLPGGELEPIEWLNKPIRWC